MKHCIYILLCILVIVECNAQSVSKEIAQIVALNYWRSNDSIPSKVSNVNSITDTKVISPHKKAPLYVVQMTDGWVLVSSEMAVTPILASSSSGIFPDFEDMPEGMQWLISHYEDANQYARDSLQNKYAMNKEWRQWLNGTYSLENQNRLNPLPSSYVLERMDSVKWNQSLNNDASCLKSYNAQCPTWYTTSCGHTYVGCTAVAMGMIMWYWQWPYSAIIPRKLQNTTSVSSYSDIPYFATYDWSHMPSEIHNNTNDYDANLIAYFLRDCGYAASMNYQESGSGASLSNAKKALTDVFHYDPILLKSQRKNYSTDIWIYLLKQEICMGCPILYAGYEDNDGPGHAFVVSGYNANNKFKVNWGWGGLYNGYYTLDMAVSGYQFDTDQEILVGIKPYSPECLTYNFIGRDDVSENMFEIHKAGILVTDSTHGEIRIHSNQQGCMYASETIVIYHPFVIEKGATVHIALRNTMCYENRLQDIDFENNQPVADNRGDKSFLQQQHDIEQIKLSVFPNPADDYIQVYSNIELDIIYIINSNGICVIQSSENIIPISSFPQGLYIVSAMTRDGQLLQGKFLKR